MINKPGIYEMSAAEYHADPAEIPSLSSSIAKAIISKSPKHGWLAHPRLGGAKDEGEEETSDPSESKAKALGTLIHRLVLGKGAEIEVINEDAYRTNVAKAKRDLAIEQDRIPVLACKLPEAEAAANACRKQLDDMGYDYVYRDGQKEVVIVWQENGIWLRAMIDWLLIDETSKTALIRDLKTVGRSSHPRACKKQINDMAYDLSLCFHRRGLVAVRPELAGRVKMAWDFLEVKPPYATTPVEINGEWEMAAEQECERAIALWRKCTAENRFPFYTDKMVRLEPDPWKIADAFMQEDAT